MQELLVMQQDGIVRLNFHQRMTVLGGIDNAEREQIVDLIHKTMHGGVDHAELRYIDASGRRLLVRRSGGRRRVTILDDAETGDSSVPGPEDLPRITHFSARDLGLTMSPDQVVSLPQLVERLIGWLGRARNAGSRGTAALAVLSEPLVGLSEVQTRDLLDAIDRLANMVQVVYLTDNPIVTQWAHEKMGNQAVHLVETAGRLS